MAIKNNLKVILKKKKISQTELASAIGVTNSAISNIINGKNDPSIELAIDIQNYVNEPFEKIFFKEVDKSYSDFLELIYNLRQIVDYGERDLMTEKCVTIATKDLVEKYISKNSYKKLELYANNELKKENRDEILEFIYKVIK